MRAARVTRREFLATSALAGAGVLAAPAWLAAAPASGARARPQAAHRGWAEAEAILARIEAPVFPDRVFPVTKYGATGDGARDCTDQGQINIRINGDPGIRLDELDRAMKKVEDLLMQQPEVQRVFTLAGGSVFGRTSRETPNQGSFNVQLKPVTERDIDSKSWSIKIKKDIDNLHLAGYTVRATVSGIRGIRLSSSDNDISLRIQGSDLETLTQLGNQVVQRIKDIDSITNVEHSYEEQTVELVLEVNRDRAADLGLHAEDIGHAINIALDGEIISDYYEGDRKYDMRMRLNKTRINSIQDMNDIIVGMKNGRAIRLRDVGRIEIKPAPANIYRDGQRRMVDITATLQPGATLNEAMDVINTQLTDLTTSSRTSTAGTSPTSTARSARSPRCWSSSTRARPTRTASSSRRNWARTPSSSASSVRPTRTSESRRSKRTISSARWPPPNQTRRAGSIRSSTVRSRA